MRVKKRFLSGVRSLGTLSTPTRCVGFWSTGVDLVYGQMYLTVRDTKPRRRGGVEYNLTFGVPTSTSDHPSLT